MAETNFTPMEKKAKGKSNVFKFVTLRNPETADTSTQNKQLIQHPDIDKSVFVSEGSDPQQKTTYAALTKVTETFSAWKSVEEVKAVNSELYDFGDWLLRNRDTVDLKVSTKLEKLTILSSDDTLKVWDNLFYYVIENKSPYIREALLTLLLADNFLNNYSKLVENDADAKMLAMAKVVIPKIILSRDPKVTSQREFPKSESKFTYVDEEEVESKIAQYGKAISELREVNKSYTASLGEVDEKVLPQEKESSAASTGEETLVSVSSISNDDIIKQVPNPLAKENLEKEVSQETLDLATELNLSDYSSPMKAIQALEKDQKELSNQLISNKVLSAKHIVAGGSVIEMVDRLPSTSDFVEGCAPTLGTQENILVNSTVTTITSVLANGLSGGVSTNSFTGLGSISFQITKRPSPGTSFVVGLSSQDGTAGIQNIDFGLKIYSYYSSSGILYYRVQAIRADGSAMEDPFTLQSGDWFKIARAQTFSGGYEVVFQRFRLIPTSAGTNIQASLMANEDITEATFNQSLRAAFKFNQRGQGIFNLHIHPCVDDDGGSGNDDGGTGNNDDEKCSGVTNLGVADYMRVEQEICCYTPGEVSHIENVMQGEYKERSTRRLRRQETTTTFETESTTEKLRDTTTTDRYEMEQESSQVIKEDSSFELGVTVSTKFGPTKLTAESGFASSSSSTNSNSQAVSYARDVSSRALDKVVQRVREERVNKIIEEFEENNTHGLDNRNNTEGHVTGLYRWVDKIYKNQLVNYGKRLSFEFMIPEPAKFHLWAMANNDSETAAIEMPEDPRENGLPTHNDVNLSNYDTWAAAYGIKVDPPPASGKRIAKAYSFNGSNNSTKSESFNDLNVPEGYEATSGRVTWSMTAYSNYYLAVTLNDEKKTKSPSDNFGSTFFNFSDIYEGTMAFSVLYKNVAGLSLNVYINCDRKPETLEQWKIDTFNLIINAYKDKKAAYDSAVAEARAQASLGIQIQGNNPLYNRTIEQQELKKNCLKWLEVEVGNNHYGTVSPCADVTDMPNLLTSEEAACYAQRAKFFEQAFDWDIMSYLFYPYFWGKKCSWKEIYKLDDNDHIFRGFLQAGMARVVVPVKPNYERAIIYYMETGEIWNGGEVPVPGDPLYVAALADIEGQEPTPVGEPWETRVPTSLNILQKDSAAVAGDGLPCGCNDYVTDATGGSTLNGDDSQAAIGTFEVS